MQMDEQALLLIVILLLPLGFAAAFIRANKREKEEIYQHVHVQFKEMQRRKFIKEQRLKQKALLLEKQNQNEEIKSATTKEIKQS